MVWKKVIESNDLIVLEKQLSEYKLKIEARKAKDDWEVFMTKVVGDRANLISEYMLNNKKDVAKLIEKLKTNKNLGNLKRFQKKKIRINLKRLYKEDFIEKWEFYIENKDEKNFIIAKFDNNIKVDIVLREKFKPYEQSIVSQVEEKLGLDELGENLLYDIYYFKNKKSSKKKANNEYNVDYIDIEFDFDKD